MLLRAVGRVPGMKHARGSVQPWGKLCAYKSMSEKNKPRKVKKYIEVMMQAG